MSILIFVILAVAVPAVLVFRKIGKSRRRGRVAATPFPEGWETALNRSCHFYRAVPDDFKSRWRGLIRIFLDEVPLEGCRGYVVDEEMRLLIAAQATLLLLGAGRESFGNVDVVLIYPDAFVAEENVELDGFGHAAVMPSVRDGEAWGGQGMVVFSAKDVRHEARDPSSGRNVVLHEFAHQLDWADGAWEGGRRVRRARHSELSATLRREYKRLCDEVERGFPGVLDEYGAESPAEFFAVATEAFFTWPKELTEDCPDLYRELVAYYGLDPGEWGAG